MSGVYSAFGGTRWAYMVGSKVRGYYLTRAEAEAAERAEMARPKAVKPQSLTQERYERAWHEKRSLR